MVNFLFFNERTKFSLFEFEFLNDPSDKNSRIGAGASASVKLAKEKKTGNLYALKMIRITNTKANSPEVYNIKCEIFIHRKLDHPNIIKFHDYIQQDSKVYLVLDYAQNQNLYTYLHRRKILTEKEIFKFFYQSCLAVQYLHQNDILHRDIKPENLLLDSQMNIKLCDFGWATQKIQDKRTTFCGTFEYMAPEIAYKRPYDYRVDIWSLGVLLFELSHGEPPYKGRSLTDIYKSFSEGLKFRSSCHPELKDLIQKILKHNPSERLTMAQILAHPWIKVHLAREENSFGPSSKTSNNKTLHHSYSLPLEPKSAIETPNKQPLGLGEPLSVTNTQAKGQPLADQWSEYYKSKQEESSTCAKTMQDLSADGGKEQGKEGGGVSRRLIMDSKENSACKSQSQGLVHQQTMGHGGSVKAFDVGTETRRERALTPNASSYQIMGDQPLNLTKSRENSGERSPKNNNVSGSNKMVDSGRNNGKKKVFEKNIFSPNFQNKLASVMRQIYVQQGQGQGQQQGKNGGQTSNNTVTTPNTPTSGNYHNKSASIIPQNNVPTFFGEKQNVYREYYDTNKEENKGGNLKAKAKTPTTVTEHSKNTFKEYGMSVKIEDIPYAPSSTTTTRANTSDLSYAMERSPYVLPNKETAGGFDNSSNNSNWRNNKHMVVNNTGNNTLRTFSDYVRQQAPPQKVDINAHYSTDRNNGDGKDGGSGQGAAGKKALQLKCILGSNPGVVRYQIPISLSISTQNRNKENFS